MKKILITGSNGLLGQKLVHYCLSNQLDFIATANSENRISFCPEENFYLLDITQKEDVCNLINNVHPTHIINTAAMTNVDACETDSDQCYAINKDGVQHLLDAIQTSSIHLIHISTDFIFDGKKRLYSEEDNANPLGVYGQSKWESEQVILASNHPNTTILRTSLVYGKGEALRKGNIFIWALEELRKGKELSIVNDQFRTPTFVEDLVQACFLVLNKPFFGILNIASAEVHSMYDFIVEIAGYLHVDNTKIIPISSAQLGQRANRPPSSGLLITKAVETINYRPTPFLQTLDQIDPLH